MRRLGLLLTVGLLALVGCNTAPTAAPAAPAFTATPPGPTETSAPTGTPRPTATPGYRLGGGALSLDTPFPAALLPDTPARFLFQGDRLQTFGLTVTPQQPDLDIRLTLSDQNHTPLLVVDRGGPGAAEVVPEFGLPVDGSYEVLVEIVAGTGDVVAELTRFSPDDRSGGGEIALDASRNGELPGTFGAPDMAASYGVAVRGGDVLVFEVAAEDPSLALHVTLLDDGYNVLGEYDAEAGGTAVSDDTYVPFDGEYTLLVRNTAGTGAYTVRVRPE